MSAKIVAYTQPHQDFDLVGLNEIIAYCARVSNPNNQDNKQTMDKLIEYLVAHKHWSPFELVNVTMELETTRDIARQLLRHRSFSFNEYSQRYADPTQDLTFVYREARLQDINNRQNSIEIEDSELQKRWLEKQEAVMKWSQAAYEWAVASGIAKEQARAVLPEGLTLSRLYVNGNIRSWIHYISLRTGVETQKEHRELAYDCMVALSTVFPLIEKFVEN